MPFGCVDESIEVGGDVTVVSTIGGIPSCDSRNFMRSEYSDCLSAKVFFMDSLRSATWENINARYKLIAEIKIRYYFG